MKGTGRGRTGISRSHRVSPHLPQSKDSLQSCSHVRDGPVSSVVDCLYPVCFVTLQLKVLIN